MSRREALLPRRPSNRANIALAPSVAKWGKRQIARAMRVPERDVLKACEDLLKAHGIRAFRMNAGDRFGSYKGKGWRIRGHAPGTADLMALIPHQQLALRYWKHVVWVECKAEGGKQSAMQKLFEDDVVKREDSYLLVSDVDQLVEWLKERGL